MQSVRRTSYPDASTRLMPATLAPGTTLRKRFARNFLSFPQMGEGAARDLPQMKESPHPSPGALGIAIPTGRAGRGDVQAGATDALDNAPPALPKFGEQRRP